MQPTAKNRACLCLNCATLAEALAQLQAEQAQHYFDPSLDLAEIRLDFMLNFTNPPALEASLQRLCWDLANCSIDVPLILTLRKIQDGGHCPNSMADGEYLNIVEQCYLALAQAQQPQAPTYLDLDAHLLQRVVEQRQPTLAQPLLQQLPQDQLIVSLHEFGALPNNEELHKLVAQLKQLVRDFSQKAIVKLALMVSNSQELLRFYQFAMDMKQSYHAPYILLAMGEFGSSSRVLSAHIGSEWTFCTSSHTPAIAPGQFQLKELLESYHYRNIDEATSIYGVIGDPVAHSHSPQLHNPIYQQYGWNACYLRFRVDKLEPFLALRELLPIKGLSCTIPHKETLAQRAMACDQASPSVYLLGASNTFYQQRNGHWLADNTDIEGFMQPLLAFCAQQQLPIRGQKAAIIGAGGAARAAVYALLSYGVDCEIHNRTIAKAQELEALFRYAKLVSNIGKVCALQQGVNISGDCNWIIQTTNVGMSHRHNSTEDPIPAYQFSAGQLAYDLIYQPPLTIFLQRAQQAGAWALNGSAMLKTQALAQIELFASQQPQ